MVTRLGSNRAAFFEAIAVILGTTIGAGILGIPYAVVKAGPGIGLIHLIGLGLVTLFCNLLLAKIIVRAKGPLELPGLAHKYLGRAGQVVMSGIFFLGMASALLAYIIGEGEVLVGIFGGNSLVWSVLFFAIGGFFVYRGLKTVKVVELVMTAGLLVVVVTLVLISVPSIQIAHVAAPSNWSHFFLPYGVILFAYHNSAAIPIAHALLPRNERLFRGALIISTIIAMIIYTVFTFMVIGVTGAGTTEVATLGLGNELGRAAMIFGNVFAFFAMGTSFILLGTALRETFEWDYKMHPALSSVLALGVPLILFLAGARSFVRVIGLAGGLFISIEILLVLLMYARVRKGNT